MAAVEHDAEVFEASAFEGANDVGDVLVDGVAHRADDADLAAPRSRSGRADREVPQLLFDSLLEAVAHLLPAGGEQLHAVVLETVVAGRDDGGGHPARRREERDRRSGDDAGELDVGAFGADAGDERGFDEWSGAPGVPSDHEGSVGAQHPGRGASERGHELGCQLAVRDPADAIGTESESHGSR